MKIILLINNLFYYFVSKMKQCQYFLFVFLLSWGICYFNANHSFSPNTTTPYVADSLLGISSAYFPGASMLNFILYGHNDAGFNYLELFQSFGTFVKNDFQPGNLVIGNDLNLGGIVGTDKNFVIFPIKAGKIQKVSVKDLSKYFPKGYKIKAPVWQLFKLQYYGIGNATYGGLFWCNYCVIFLSSKYETPEPDIFYLNQIFNLEIINQTTKEEYDMNGYLYSYNSNMSQGAIKVNFFGNKKLSSTTYNYSLSSFSYPNLVSFSLFGTSLTYNGTVVYGNTSVTFFS